MTLPTQPLTLTVEQIGELNKSLADMRHDINNHLSLMIAAVELIRHKPQTSDRMLGAITERLPKISESMAKFSANLEKGLGITRD